jgi:tetratricopeptide (TPR) repeat protein
MLQTEAAYGSWHPDGEQERLKKNPPACLKDILMGVFSISTGSRMKLLCIFFSGIPKHQRKKGLICRLSDNIWSGGNVKTTIYSNGNAIIPLSLHKLLEMFTFISRGCELPKAITQKMINLNNLPRTKGLFPNPIVLQLFICLFLALISLMAYWQVRNNEFINLDDDLYVTDNPNVRKGLTSEGIVWAFTSIHKGHWHPITWLSHMLDCNLYGLNPSGHHMTNLFFHMANTLMLFLLLHRMTASPWRSGFVAALFAIHPLHVESVAWVAERKDVLYAFFWLLSIWSYVLYVQTPKCSRYLLVILCFVLSIMSKPMAVTLPFALLLLDYWPLGRLRLRKTDNGLNPSVLKSVNVVPRSVLFSRLVLEKIPLFFLAAVLSLFTILAHRGSGAISSLDKLPLEVRIGNALVSYIKYISKMIWPDRLAILYPHPIILPFREVVGAALLLVVVTVLVFLVRRKYPYFIAGWLWFLGTLLPVIGLIQAGTQALADRFTYLPFIGLFIMLVFGISDILGRWRYGRAALATSGALLVAVLMISTVLQVQIWRNSVTLFDHTLRMTVNNYLIHNNLGVTLARQGNEQEAFDHYIKALEINPRYSDARYNVATLLARQGKDQEAIAHFAELLRVKPDKVEAHNDLGVILAKHGKTQESVAHFAKAISIDPNYAEAYVNFGIALSQQTRNKEAIPYFNEALRINPRDDKIYNHLAVALAAVGRTQEAMAHYNQALQINPGNTDAHYNLGSLLTLQGRDQEAVSHYYEILRINPSDPQAHYELANILVRQRKNEDAAAHLAEVVRITPDYGEAHLTLGMLYLTMGKKDLALAQYKILKALNKNLANTLYQKIAKQNS